MVPGAGLEPARGYPQQILSLLRLPVPPSRRKNRVIMRYFDYLRPAKCSQDFVQSVVAKVSPTYPRRLQPGEAEMDAHYMADGTQRIHVHEGG